MQAHEHASPPEAPARDTLAPMRELPHLSRQTEETMSETESSLRALRQRFDRTQDPRLRGELAVEALEHVEGELRLIRSRRHELDSIEGTLWARRNRLERFLIQARGREWWRAWRARARPEALGSEGS
jgi:hypothetical protein